MPENLMVLLIRLQDELNRLFVLLQVLEIALEQIDQPDEKTMSRIDLLISLYLPQAEYRFDELKYITDRIKRLLREDDQGDQQ